MYIIFFSYRRNRKFRIWRYSAKLWSQNVSGRWVGCERKRRRQKQYISISNPLQRCHAKSFFSLLLKPSNVILWVSQFKHESWRASISTKKSYEVKSSLIMINSSFNHSSLPSWQFYDIWLIYARSCDCAKSKRVYNYFFTPGIG